MNSQQQRDIARLNGNIEKVSTMLSRWMPKEEVTADINQMIENDVHYYLTKHRLIVGVKAVNKYPSLCSEVDKVTLAYRIAKKAINRVMCYTVERERLQVSDNAFDLLEGSINELAYYHSCIVKAFKRDGITRVNNFTANIGVDVLFSVYNAMMTEDVNTVSYLFNAAYVCISHICPQVESLSQALINADDKGVPGYELSCMSYINDIDVLYMLVDRIGFSNGYEMFRFYQSKTTVLQRQALYSLINHQSLPDWKRHHKARRSIECKNAKKVLKTICKMHKLNKLL